MREIWRLKKSTNWMKIQSFFSKRRKAFLDRYSGIQTLYTRKTKALPEFGDAEQVDISVNFKMIIAQIVNALALGLADRR